MPLHRLRMPSPDAILMVPSIMPLYTVPELIICMRVCNYGASVSLLVLARIGAAPEGVEANLEGIDGIHDGVFLVASWLALRPWCAASCERRTNRDTGKGAGRHVLGQGEVGREGLIAAGRKRSGQYQAAGDAEHGGWALPCSAQHTRTPRPARHWAGPSWPQRDCLRRRPEIEAPGLRVAGVLLIRALLAAVGVAIPDSCGSAHLLGGTAGR